MKKGKVTIHDISKSLNIDSSTVSRALNNSSRVSKKTKDKINRKAEELGYQRNMMASKLRTNRSNAIGVIVPRISRHFFSSVIAGIEETAYDAGYDVIICQSLDNLEREINLIDTMLSNRVDGVLISHSMETTSFNHFDKYKDHGYPIIFFDRPYDLDNNTNVIIDDHKASFEATEHLILKGCKNIVHFAGPQEIEIYRRRTRGYISALEKYGLKLRENYIFESSLMKDDGVNMAKGILKLPIVDGVFSSNDVAAISAMQYLKAQNISIPSDISFVGFSNEPISSVMEPSLTTVAQPDFEMGKVATNLLLEKINNNETVDLNETIVLKPELLKRDSTNRYD